MLREIIKPTKEDYVLHIPKEYINTRIEILVLPYPNMSANIKSRSKQAPRTNLYNEQISINNTRDQKNLLIEFNKINQDRHSKPTIDKNINLIKADEELYNDIF